MRKVIFFDSSNKTYVFAFNDSPVYEVYDEITKRKVNVKVPYRSKFGDKFNEGGMIMVNCEEKSVWKYRKTEFFFQDARTPSAKKQAEVRLQWPEFFI